MLTRKAFIAAAASIALAGCGTTTAAVTHASKSPTRVGQTTKACFVKDGATVQLRSDGTGTARWGATWASWSYATMNGQVIGYLTANAGLTQPQQATVTRCTNGP